MLTSLRDYTVTPPIQNPGKYTVSGFHKTCNRNPRRLTSPSPNEAGSESSSLSMARLRGTSSLSTTETAVASHNGVNTSSSLWLSVPVILTITVLSFALIVVSAIALVLWRQSKWSSVEFKIGFRWWLHKFTLAYQEGREVQPLLHLQIFFIEFFPPPHCVSQSLTAKLMHIFWLGLLFVH